jgi:hypothetical protein
MQPHLALWVLMGRLHDCDSTEKIALVPRFPQLPRVCMLVMMV